MVCAAFAALRLLVLLLCVISAFDPLIVDLCDVLRCAVYNNDQIEPAKLEHILSTCERNPLVKQLPTKYQTELAMVQQKLAYYNSHPVRWVGLGWVELHHLTPIRTPHTGGGDVVRVLARRVVPQQIDENVRRQIG
jgi:hypothetical protein